jgi:hypothetical protein
MSVAEAPSSEGQGGVFDILGGAPGGLGGLPGLSGGDARSGASSYSGSIYNGPIDSSVSMPFTFGGSGAGVNSGFGVLVPILAIGGLIILGFKWLSK